MSLLTKKTAFFTNLLCRNPSSFSQSFLTVNVNRVQTDEPETHTTVTAAFIHKAEDFTKTIIRNKLIFVVHISGFLEPVSVFNNSNRYYNLTLRMNLLISRAFRVKNNKFTLMNNENYNITSQRRIRSD